MELGDRELERYGRQMALEGVGVRGQEALRCAKVLVIGAGGLGSAALMYLAGAGIGTIGIADGDKVEIGNLHRQVIHDSSSAGQAKTASAAARIRALNPDAAVVAHSFMVTPENIDELVEPYDFVIDATDGLDSKYIVNDGCVKAAKPFAHGSAVAFKGQAMTYVPGRGPCLRCVFPQPPARPLPTCADIGVAGPLPGMVGCLQALEAVKYITGVGSLLCGRMLTIDALDMRFRTIDILPSDDCPACSKGCS